MDNLQLAKDIKESLTEMLQHKKSAEVKPTVNTIVRSLGRIKTENKSAQLSLLKIANDLKSIVITEEQFHLQQDHSLKKINFSDSFYVSLSVLKEDLFKILDELIAGS